MTETGPAGVSEALVADLYLRVERVEQELQRLAQRTVDAPPVTTAGDTTAAAETRRVPHPPPRETAETPPLRWPVPRLAASPDAPAILDSELLRAAVDLCTDPLVGLDLHGQVTIWNPAAVTRFGWTAAEVLNRPAPFVPDDRAAEHSELRRDPRALRGGQEIETVRLDKSGLRHRLQLRVAPSSCGGLVFGFREAIEAVSDPAAPLPLPVEVAVPRDASLTRHAAVGKLVAGVAHDFNNILAVLQGYGELLSEQLPPGGQLGDAAGAIVSAAGLGGAISRHLLSLAAPEPTTPPAADVGLLLRQTDRFLRSLVGAGVRVNVTAPAGLPGAKCHPAELFQVVLNLAANARDAMPGGGVLSVRASAAVVPPGRARWPDLVRPGEFIVLTVADTGHGMTPETLARLPTPGFTTRPDGHGLGLATVRAIVARAEGHIEVESDPEWGTCFTVYLRKAQ